MRKGGLKRTRSFLFLPLPFRALAASFSIYVRIYPFLLPARRAMTDFPMTRHSVLNMVRNNDKFNQFCNIL